MLEKAPRQELVSLSKHFNIPFLFVANFCFVSTVVSGDPLKYTSVDMASIASAFTKDQETCPLENEAKQKFASDACSASVMSMMLAKSAEMFSMGLIDSSFLEVMPNGKFDSSLLSQKLKETMSGDQKDGSELSVEDAIKDKVESLVYKLFGGRDDDTAAGILNDNVTGKEGGKFTVTIFVYVLFCTRFLSETIYVGTKINRTFPFWSSNFLF